MFSGAYSLLRWQVLSPAKEPPLYAKLLYQPGQTRSNSPWTRQQYTSIHGEKTPIQQAFVLHFQLVAVAIYDYQQGARFPENLKPSGVFLALGATQWSTPQKVSRTWVRRVNGHRPFVHEVRSYDPKISICRGTHVGRWRVQRGYRRNWQSEDAHITLPLGRARGSNMRWSFIKFQRKNIKICKANVLGV